jgi:hypothetical protein
MRRTLRRPRLAIRKRVVLGAAMCINATGCTSSTEQSQTLTPATLEAVTSTVLAGTVGTEVTPAPTVRVKDRNGNPMQGVQVFFTVTAGAGTPQSVSKRTGADGTASVAWTLGWNRGANSLAASAGGGSLVFTATADAGPPAFLRRLTDVRLGIAGTTLGEPLAVRIDDRFGNSVAGVAVSFDVISGGGTVGGSIATTDYAGIARSGPWTLGAPGENVVRASSPGLPPVAFTLAALGSGGLAGLSYELENTTIGSSSHSGVTSRIVFGQNGEFSLQVTVRPGQGDSVLLEGHGVYWTSDSVILLKYAGGFLSSLFQALSLWPPDGPADSDTGSILGDAIKILRCWGEDLTASGPIAAWTSRGNSRMCRQ